MNPSKSSKQANARAAVSALPVEQAEPSSSSEERTRIEATDLGRWQRAGCHRHVA